MIDTLKADLPQFISAKRCDHVARVAEMATELAQHWDQSEDTIATAAWAHDIAKNLTPDTLADHGATTTMTDLYETYPKVWHAFTGPELLKAKYNYDNEAVADAMRWHTTGKAGMSNPAKIVYVADFIERGRDHEYREFIEELAFKDLDQAVYATAWCATQSLLDRGLIIHPNTVECYNHAMSLLSSQVCQHIAKTCHVFHS